MINNGHNDRRKKDVAVPMLDETNVCISIYSLAGEKVKIILY